jgi:hypothetical protein
LPEAKLASTPSEVDLFPNIYALKFSFLRRNTSRNVENKGCPHLQSLCVGGTDL